MIGGMADASSATPEPIVLRVAPPRGEPVLEGDIVLEISGEPVAFHLEVPSGPTTLEALLPVFQGLADAMAGRAAGKAVAAGETISCRAGCGACCRQAVPVAEAEARAIAALVEAMPEPRRTTVRERFAAASTRLQDTAQASRRIDIADDKTAIDVGNRYFGLGVPCPFLEDESCSIYADRPLRCREYLVTSPAAACAAMVPGTVRKAPLAGAPSSALFAVGKAVTPEGWLLLTQALAFAARFPAPSAALPAPQWIARVIGRLAGRPPGPDG
jgi:Fe-S-cluster containining protein